MLGSITWTRIKTIPNSEKYFRKDQKVQVEAGGGEAVLHNLAFCWTIFSPETFRQDLQHHRRTAAKDPHLDWIAKHTDKNIWAMTGFAVQVYVGFNGVI